MDIISLSNETVKIPLVVIIGPTAVGKTGVAIELAEIFTGEIVSADSRLFYRGMDIGTAKPTTQERLRVPHHLIDIADPDETWSLALFQVEANRIITEIYQRQHLPFLVGGTGQFMRSIIEGWKIPPANPDRHLRDALQHWAEQVGSTGLHERLAVLDPQAANSIDPSNLRRTIRALEVIFTTGRRFSEQRLSGQTLYQPLRIGLIRPRAELYQRIDERINKMLECGFVDEVRALLDAGNSPDLPTMSAIGYHEIIAYLHGNISLDEAVALMKRRTREFVRRQANWFKENDPAIQWFQMDKGTIQDIEETIKRWLNSHLRWNFPFGR
ncbi:MAG TPA: tRNA (adenosine(37)-N6)-dimethylallyltransferase MiaA [Anaerolineales bacterium]|nr:tRNA (adenosine(37)-N6)-dimethylallyltransferase MiaA [Anaerolineales bacterium]